MAKKEIIKYWIKTANQDWKVANHLFEKGDYSYALFFGHLTIEKILKGIFTNKQNKTPPFSGLVLTSATLGWGQAFVIDIIVCFMV